MANGETIEVKIGRHDERIKDLEDYKLKHQEEHIRVMEMIKKIENRPSWAVTIVLSSMASTIVYLIMRVVG